MQYLRDENWREFSSRQCLGKSGDRAAIGHNSYFKSFEGPATLETVINFLSLIVRLYDL